MLRLRLPDRDSRFCNLPPAGEPRKALRDPRTIWALPLWAISGSSVLGSVLAIAGAGYVSGGGRRGTNLRNYAAHTPTWLWGIVSEPQREAPAFAAHPITPVADRVILLRADPVPSPLGIFRPFHAAATSVQQPPPDGLQRDRRHGNAMLSPGLYVSLITRTPPSPPPDNADRIQV